MSDQPHVGALYPDPSKLKLPAKHVDQNAVVQDRIRETRKIYANFEPEFCPAINETVYFPMSGFDHLITKERFRVKGRRRNHTIKSRMRLVPFIPEVVKNCKNVAEIRYYEEDYYKTRPKYFCLEDIITLDGEPVNVRVVFRRQGMNGNFQFLSIMRFEDKPAESEHVIQSKKPASAAFITPLNELTK